MPSGLTEGNPHILYMSILQEYQARMESGGSDSQSGGTSNRAMEMTLAPSRADSLQTGMASAERKQNSLEKKRIKLALHRYTKCSS